MLAQVLHVRDVGKRLVQLDVHLVTGFVEQRLHDLPAETKAKGQARAQSPGVINISRPFMVGEIGRRQRYGGNSVVCIAQHEIRARIAAALSGARRTRRRNGVRELAAEIELAAREFVSELRKLVVPELPAKTQRMLP